ncbi:hypothetical protein M3Y99_00874700 [Aphelenchoides fujianensis]|nr:hypothetical protein M3Y99_00874700 [Aphelenchoides fujianensis]
MRRPNGNESAVLDSWEDVDDAAKLDMTQLNEVFEKMKVDAKQTKDPLDAKAAKGKAWRAGTTPNLPPTLTSLCSSVVRSTRTTWRSWTKS